MRHKVSNDSDVTSAPSRETDDTSSVCSSSLTSGPVARSTDPDDAAGPSSIRFATVRRLRFFDPTDKPESLVPKSRKRKTQSQKLPNMKPVSLARPIPRSQLTPEQRQRLLLRRQAARAGAHAFIPRTLLANIIVTGVLVTSARVALGTPPSS